MSELPSSMSDFDYPRSSREVRSFFKRYAVEMEDTTILGVVLAMLAVVVGSLFIMQKKSSQKDQPPTSEKKPKSHPKKAQAKPTEADKKTAAKKGRGVVNALRAVEERKGATGAETDILPMVAMTKVLSHLPLRSRVRTARVCQSWREALREVTSPVYVNDEELYQKKRQRKAFAFEDVLQSITRKFPRMTVLSIELHQDAFLGLNQRKLKMNSDWLYDVLVNCPAVTMIELSLPEMAEEESIKIFNARVLPLLCSRRMQAFSISGVVLPSASTFASLLRSWPAATALRFDSLLLDAGRAPDMHSMSSHHDFAPGLGAPRRAVLDALSRLTQLQRLSLERWELSDADLRAFLPQLRHLAHLDLSGAFGDLDRARLGLLTDASMLMISKSCPRLQELSVNYNRRITRAGVLAVLQALPVLRELEIEAAHIFAKDMPQILAASSSLYLLRVSDLTDGRAAMSGGPATSAVYHHHRILVCTVMGGLVEPPPRFRSSIARSRILVEEAQRRTKRNDRLDFSVNGWDFLASASEAELERVVALQPAVSRGAARVEGELEEDRKCSCGERQRLKRCSNCMLVWYCSQECQRRDWPQHKRACRAAVEAAAAAAAPRASAMAGREP